LTSANRCKFLVQPIEGKFEISKGVKSEPGIGAEQWPDVGSLKTAMRFRLIVAILSQASVLSARGCAIATQTGPPVKVDASSNISCC